MSWALCEVPGVPESLYSGTALTPPPSDQPLEVSADRAHLERGGVSIFSGDVEARRGGLRLFADKLEYLDAQALIRGSGSVRFTDDLFTITGPQAEVDLDTYTGAFESPHYVYAPRHARGQARRIVRESQEVARLKGATYTTCDLGDQDWSLKADEVVLDFAKGEGTARDARVDFMHVPIFYWPWFRFPIDDRRKSGFLIPTLGQASTYGLELATPFYLNLAPNYDATLTPRLLSQRGLLLESEFRYLTRKSAGELNLNYLSDQKTSTNRYLFALNNVSTLNPRLIGLLNFNQVSDDDYLDDLGSELTDSAIVFLERRGELIYHGDNFTLLTRAQDFQILDELLPEPAEPYARLPQILFSGRLEERALGLGYETRAEATHFEHDVQTTGNRLDLRLRFDRPFIGTGFFLTPAATLWHTRYTLEGDSPATLTRTLPILSLDTGLIFERILNQGRLQTLEPRLFYTYIPQRDQDEIPIFDTTLLDFNFSQLFRENRFSGPDRVGDANQLTAALTTRFLDLTSGLETLSASVGQIFYFDPPEVALPGPAPLARNVSDTVGDLSLRLGRHWSTGTTVLWDTDNRELQRAALRLRYQSEGNRIVNLAYRFRRELIKQTDVAFAWPVSARWAVVGRWNYDLLEERNIEWLSGVEYESCCWKVRLAARRYLTDENGAFTTAFHIELALKGLTQLGSRLGALLERDIIGYEE